MPDLRILTQETVGHGLAARAGFRHVQNHAIQQCRLELKLFEEFNYLGILLRKGRGCADRQPGCQKVGRTQLAFAAYDSVPTSLIKWILLDFVELVLGHRSEEHTSELQSLIRTSYVVFCLKKKNTIHKTT